MPMTTTAAQRFQALLSRGARMGPRAMPRSGPTIYKFGAGNPDPGSFPYQELVQAMADVMELDGAHALSYGSAHGYDGLRDLVVEKYRLLEGLQTSRDNILIANGSNQAIALVVGAFVDEGDPVICEAPTYMASIQTLRRHGADLIGIEVDGEGMRTDLVAERLGELKRSGRQCKLIYTIAQFQNPAGPTLSERRRRELVELAREHNVMILEDDAYGELRYEGQAPPSIFSLDPDGLVCRTGTLSKILGPGVRIGWVVAPPALVPYLSAFNFGGGVAPLTSRVCTFYLRAHLQPHVAELVDIYRAKRDAMLDELERGLADTDASWSRPEGGFFIWLKLPSRTDLQRLSQLAAAAGVGYNPGPIFMANGGGEEYIRLAYSFEAPAEIREGTRLLCRAIKGARTTA